MQFSKKQYLYCWFIFENPNKCIKKKIIWLNQLKCWSGDGGGGLSLSEPFLVSRQVKAHRICHMGRNHNFNEIISRNFLFNALNVEREKTQTNFHENFVVVFRILNLDNKSRMFSSRNIVTKNRISKQILTKILYF